MQTTNHNPLPLPFAGVLPGVGIERTAVAQAGETPDTNRLTQLTADRMRRAIIDGAGHPLVVQAVGRALVAAGVRDWRDHGQVAHAVWNWVRDHVAFVADESVLVSELGLEGELELLITPPVLLSMSRPAGDCDDFTMLTGAMLLSAGVPRVEVTTIAADGADPSRWSHVYLTATLNTGGQVVMDCSHGQWFGWEAPQYYNRKTWGGITAPAAALMAHNREKARAMDQGRESNDMRLVPRANRPATPGTMPAGLGLFQGGFAPGAYNVPQTNWGNWGGNWTVSPLGGWYDRVSQLDTRGNQLVTTNRDRCNPTIDGDCDDVTYVFGMGAIDWGQFTQQVTTGAIDIVKQVTQKPGQFIQTSGGVISSQVPGATPNPGGISITSPVGGATIGSGSGINGTTLLVGAVVIGAALLFGRR